MRNKEDKSITNEIAREYLLKYPKKSKSYIAKLLYEDHPLLFKSQESARFTVRYLTASAGKHRRKYVKNPIKHISSTSARGRSRLPANDKAREYILKYPQNSKRTIAKKLFKDHPSLFRSDEAARDTIRYLTKSSGKKNRKAVVDSVDHANNFTRENPFGLPESDYEEFLPFVIPLSVKDLLIGSDFHFLFQDNKAISKWLDYGIGQKVGGILLNGDLMDMYQVSRFLKKPRIGDIQREFEEVRNFLVMLRKKFPHIPIYFKEGNHEERWELNLRTNAPMLFDMEEFQLKVILKLAELNIDFITDKRIVKYSGLNIIHGHEVPFSSSANGARALFLKTGVSTLASHVHRTSEHIDKNLDGNIIGSWTIGSLCGLNPEYAIRSNKYNHGFAHVLRAGDHFNVRNFKMVDYKIL